MQFKRLPFIYVLFVVYQVLFFNLLLILFHQGPLSFGLGPLVNTCILVRLNFSFFLILFSNTCYQNHWFPGSFWLPIFSATYTVYHQVQVALWNLFLGRELQFIIWFFLWLSRAADIPHWLRCQTLVLFHAPVSFIPIHLM